MSALDSGKPFDELNDDEVAELSVRDWSAAEIMAAISLALKERDMEIVVSLMHMLAVKDPASAELIVGAIEALR